MEFIVKTPLAETLQLRLAPGMATLRDLRGAIQRRWKLPPYLQRITCRGREYKEHPQEMPIKEVLRGTEKDVEQGGERIIWLNWLGDNDLCEITDNFEFFSLDEKESVRDKRIAQGEPFLTVPLLAYRKIAEDAVEQYISFRHSAGDDGNEDNGGDGGPPPDSDGDDDDDQPPHSRHGKKVKGKKRKEVA